MKCRETNCGFPISGDDDYPDLCWRHIPDVADRYPVIVEYTYRHVIWVAGDDQANAVEQAQDAPYEQTNDQETLVEAGWSVKAPKDRWDWGDVMEGSYSHPYPGTEADAHVQTHRAEVARVAREAKKAACCDAGHPGSRPLTSGPYCDTCGYLKTETVASL